MMGVVMRQIFKCAEDPDHVKKVNITKDDVMSVFDFIDLFKVPTTWSRKEVDETLGDGKDKALNHNVVHMIMDDLVTAWKSGHPAMMDDMFVGIWEEMAKKQEECRNGHKHA